MELKLNFYKKLEIQMLQKAYNKILYNLRESKSALDKGEFSMLNNSAMNISQSKVMPNKSNILK